ncbi:MAG: Hpt domain-containing protein [Oleiphilaceae bacterium]|nr:Hpt domain-containing protein [Oleiphilaceae bacterium]
MSVLDTETVSELKLIMDGELPVLVNSFIENSEKLLCELAQDLRDANHEGFIIRIHSLKGSCRNIGALTMGDHCQAVEAKARAGELDALSTELEALQQELRDVSEALKKI